MLLTFLFAAAFLGAAIGILIFIVKGIIAIYKFHKLVNSPLRYEYPAAVYEKLYLSEYHDDTINMILAAAVLFISTLAFANNLFIGIAFAIIAIAGCYYNFKINKELKGA